MCRFYPVSFGQSAESNPEEAKVKDLDEFMEYVKEVSSKIQKDAFLKNKINNYFIPKIGFSDDDLKNVDVVKKHFEKNPENIIKTYLTKGGIKKEY